MYKNKINFKILKKSILFSYLTDYTTTIYFFTRTLTTFNTTTISIFFQNYDFYYNNH